MAGLGGRTSAPAAKGSVAGPAAGAGKQDPESRKEAPGDEAPTTCMACGKSGVLGHREEGDGEFAGIFYCDGCWTTWECKFKAEKVETELKDLREEFAQFQSSAKAMEARTEQLTATAGPSMGLMAETHTVVLKLLEDLRTQVSQLEGRVAAAEAKVEKATAAPLDAGLVAETHAMVLKLLEAKAGSHGTPPRKTLSGLTDDDAHSAVSTEAPQLSTEHSFSPGRLCIDSEAPPSSEGGTCGSLDAEESGSWVQWLVSSISLPCAYRSLK